MGTQPYSVFIGYAKTGDTRKNHAPWPMFMISGSPIVGRSQIGSGEHAKKRLEKTRKDSKSLSTFSNHLGWQLLPNHSESNLNTLWQG